MVNERGFLQIELIILIMVIGILAGTLSGSPTDKTDKLILLHETRLLAAELRWLQQQSMNLATGHSAFSTVKGDLVPKMRFVSGTQSKYSILLGVSTVKVHTFVSGVELGGNYGAVWFNRNGCANTPVTITVQQGNQRKKVVIDRVGRIRVSD